MAKIKICFLTLGISVNIIKAQLFQNIMNRYGLEATLKSLKKYLKNMVLKSLLLDKTKERLGLTAREAKGCDLFLFILMRN